jgi:uncharacterized membrane protein
VAVAVVVIWFLVSLLVAAVAAALVVAVAAADKAQGRHLRLLLLLNNLAFRSRNRIERTVSKEKK